MSFAATESRLRGSKNSSDSEKVHIFQRCENNFFHKLNAHQLVQIHHYYLPTIHLIQTPHLNFKKMIKNMSIHKSHSGIS